MIDGTLADEVVGWVALYKKVISKTLKVRFVLLHIQIRNVFIHVPPKMTGGFAREAALMPLERLYSGVDVLGLFQIPSSSARKVALITLERLLSFVLALVHFQTTSFSARIIALIAFERFYT